ncbi:efflux RND transporter periplasmic adaptor subunit [Alkalihalobacillus sp. MEB130]|uniref:efflux RND transporter periplasmic adaptor subunit n=1 Tax=Alkalihalobacillus sp. MEB130 TaxID=2976704 RepID=UPI0028DF48D8|nr:efflux RND transporter periplasmic adaptor subunit [Alkalihalobacillus sp. MEB130]MDT8858857.1 efflux RND transporter periplasmic adaptor subunit [Alkalihalobacillus sp. MEB130]
MNKWKIYVIAFASISLITVNLYLIMENKNKIPRTQLVALLSPMEQDLIESLEKPGVILSTNEEPIYFDEKIGSMGSLYVEKGQEVQFGDLLFTYENIEMETTIQQLNSQIDQLDLKISQLEEEIRTIVSIQNQLYQHNVSEEVGVTAFQNQQIDQYQVQILQKQHEIEALDFEKERYQDSLFAIENQQEELEVTSPVSGIIKEINALSNGALMTIVSDSLRAQGELTQLESQNITEGLKVKISAPNQQPIEGSLTRISNLPTKEPALDQEATYPFYVDWDFQQEEFKVGYHVNLSIIENEIHSALTIPQSGILTDEEGPYVLVIEEGYIVKREIELGISQNDDQHVTSGVLFRDMLVANPSGKADNHPFVTKLQIQEIDETARLAFRSKTLLTLMLQGFVQ